MMGFSRGVGGKGGKVMGGVVLGEGGGEGWIVMWMKWKGRGEV